MSSQFAERLDEVCAHHGQRPVLIDANLLVVLFVGWTQPSMVGQGRTEGYGLQDFVQLDHFLRRFSGVLTTAHVLTETNNLCRQTLKGRLRWALAESFRQRVVVFNEIASPTKKIVANEDFELLGLTDAAIIHAAEQTRSLVLSTDAGLVGRLLERDLPVLNWNWVREDNWS